MKAIRHALPQTPVDTYPKTDFEIRSFDRLIAGLKLLTRACIRDTATGLSEVWELAHELYQHPVVSTGFVTGKELGELFRSLIESTDRADLANFLWTFFELPLPGERGFTESMAEWWSDLNKMINSGRFRQIADRPASQWSHIKQRLFSFLKVENLSLKRAAFDRLVLLDKVGLMDVREQKQLGFRFWASAGRGAKLPLDTWGAQSAFLALKLPSPRGVSAEERVRHYILADKGSDSESAIAWPRHHLSLIRFATAPLTRLEGFHQDRKFVAWTQAELTALLEGILVWWQSTGREQAATNQKRRGWSHLFSSDMFARSGNLLWDVLRAVIIPGMDRRSSLTSDLLKFIDEVQESGIPVGAVLPATLLLRPERAGAVATYLRRELANPNREHLLSALRGIVYWFEVRTSGRSPHLTRLPEVPLDLLREVGSAVALRTSEDLALSLDCTANVLNQLGTTADTEFVRSLIRGLDYLFTETAYRESALPESAHQYEDIPRIRERAAWLARCLAKNGHAQDEIVQRWCQAAANDPLPEVRRAVLDGG